MYADGCKEGRSEVERRVKEAQGFQYGPALTPTLHSLIDKGQGKRETRLRETV